MVSRSGKPALLGRAHWGSGCLPGLQLQRLPWLRFQAVLIFQKFPQYLDERQHSPMNTVVQ